jgi:regulatory protein
MKAERIISPEEALSRLQNLCSGHEKCSGDVREKLRQWKISAEESDKILWRLIKDKFIDDQRFVGFFVRDKQNINKWGKEKIRFALKNKGINQELINEALSLLPAGNYEESLRELLSKKARELSKYPPYEKKNRLIRFAAQRGFDFDLIFKIIDEFVRE